MEIQPIQDLVKAGLIKVVTQEFNAPCAFTTATDKTRTLAKMFGRNPEYPYITIVIQSFDNNRDSYGNAMAMRDGILIATNTQSNQVTKLQIIPTNYVLEVTYVTNDASQGELFAAKWVKNSKIRNLNFNIVMGLTRVPINYTLTGSVSFPQKENPPDAEPKYEYVGNITLHGYTSGDTLTKVGLTSDVRVLQSIAPGQINLF